MQVSDSLATAVSLGTQPIAPGCRPAGATADEDDVPLAPEAPPPALRAICRRLRLPAHREAGWAASGPRPALRFCLYFACGLTQCALAIVVFGVPVPLSMTLLAVRVIPGWVYVAARALTVAWVWFAGPARTPAWVTAFDAVAYSVVGITTCLQPRARVPYRSRFVFSALNGALVFCGCGTVLWERPGGVHLAPVPVLWALGVRTIRFVDAFTDLAFARLVIEDVRPSIPPLYGVAREALRRPC